MEKILEKTLRGSMIGLLICTIGFALLALLPSDTFKSLMGDFFPTSRGGYYKLDLEDFSHHRQPNQFQLYVRLRNISRQPLEDVQAVVTVFDQDGTQLDTLVYPLDMNPLPPAQEVSFNITFTENIPVYRYTIYFKNKQGKTIPHRQGL